jgi:hypothetical protein
VELARLREEEEEVHERRFFSDFGVDESDGGDEDITCFNIESGGEGAAEYLHRLARSIRDGHTWLRSSWTLDRFGVLRVMATMEHEY